MTCLGCSRAHPYSSILVIPFPEFLFVDQVQLLFFTFAGVDAGAEEENRLPKVQSNIQQLLVGNVGGLPVADLAKEYKVQCALHKPFYC